MTKLHTLRQACAAFFLLLFSIAALAQSAAGNWDLTEPSGGPSIGKMILSRDGSINFDGLIGSWSQSGNSFSATLYGSEQLRAAGMPAGKISFDIHGDTASGTLHNLINNNSTRMGARRQGAPLASNNTNSNSNAHARATVGPAPQQTIETPCGKPGAINECMKAPPCPRGESRVDGRCVKPTITCIAPSVLQDGRCVRPAAPAGNAGSDNGGVAGGGGSGRDAKQCVQIRSVPQKGGIAPHQSITNTCNEEIGLIWCHDPSEKPGTKSTVCGYDNRYYEQFMTLKAGETHENGYSMPPGVTIHFGACFGGERKIKQTTDGNYICR